MHVTNTEIIRDYNEAKNKKAQIKILADLNAVTPDAIRQILIDNGAIEAPSPKPEKHESAPSQQGARTISKKWSDEEIELLLKLRAEGKDWDEISSILGRNQSGVSWLYWKVSKERDTGIKIKGKKSKAAVINEDFDRAFDDYAKSDTAHLPGAADEPDADVQLASPAVDVFAYIDKLHGVFGGDIKYIKYDRDDYSLELTFGHVHIQIDNFREAARV